jgi:hypothetical protein
MAILNHLLGPLERDTEISAQTTCSRCLCVPHVLRYRAGKYCQLRWLHNTRIDSAQRNHVRFPCGNLEKTKIDPANMPTNFDGYLSCCGRAHADPYSGFPERGDKTFDCEDALHSGVVIQRITSDVRLVEGSCPFASNGRGTVPALCFVRHLWRMEGCSNGVVLLIDIGDNHMQWKV